MTIIQSKKFNISGPCNPLKHYMISALPRLPDIKGLIGGEEYFVLHAPRQSGKTTAIISVVEKLNQEASYYALYCSLAQLHKVIDEDKAMQKLIGILNRILSESSVEALKKISDDNFSVDVIERPGFHASPVQVWLSTLRTRIDKDLVVFFDEADSLEERILLSFLSQLRDGYIARNLKTPFPSSIALISMRNIRDYKVKIRPDSETMGSASPFNIITEALTLANFTQEEIKILYNQHTQATGQIFEDEAVERAWYWSEGQPWLVNALARQAVDKILKCDYVTTVTSQHMDQAADNLMKLRDTHIDSLMARLRETRVRRFIEPMLAASKESSFCNDLDGGIDSYDDDLQYCFDLGLIKDDLEKRVRRPSNPIYASVMVRYLNQRMQDNLPREIMGKWMDGRSIDMTGLLQEFQKFWALKSEKYLAGLLYTEAGPHILLSAFLQRVVNGGATVIEEYADDLGYADIVVKYAGQNYVIELKIKDNQRSEAKSQEQLLRYMDGLLVKEGWLVIFDRKSEKSWTKKITWETVTMPEGQTIHIVGC